MRLKRLLPALCLGITLAATLDAAFAGHAIAAVLCGVCAALQLRWLLPRRPLVIGGGR